MRFATYEHRPHRVAVVEEDGTLHPCPDGSLRS